MKTSKTAKGEYKVIGQGLWVMENSEPDKDTANYWYVQNDEGKVLEVEVEGEIHAAWNTKKEAIKAAELYCMN